MQEKECWTGTAFPVVNLRRSLAVGVFLDTHIFETLGYPSSVEFYRLYEVEAADNHPEDSSEEAFAVYVTKIKHGGSDLQTRYSRMNVPG
jgi:hypothetical protein